MVRSYANEHNQTMEFPKHAPKEMTEYRETHI